jgi:hypothetical protein
MASRTSRARQNRRDRRKAKESGWRREGTVNPKKVTHHLTEGHGSLGKPKKGKPPPAEETKLVLDEGRAATNLGRLLRPAPTTEGDRDGE